MEATTSSETTIENGSCLCGSVRYQIQTSAKRQVTHCHCTICRRASGAPFVTWVTVLTSGFEWMQGEDDKEKEEALQVYCSSPRAKRFFCRTCGSPLLFQHEDCPTEVDITAGSLVECKEIQADHHIFVGTKMAGIHVDEHLPSYEHETPSDWKKQADGE